VPETITPKHKLAIFCSGGGSNAEALMQYFTQHPSIEVAMLLSNKPDAFALQRAATHNIPTHTFTREAWKDGTVLQTLQSAQVTALVLAGFLWLVPDVYLQTYTDKVFNIHPALLPKFGGKGMHGLHVHEAVIAAGETETGITIHLCNAEYDKGNILYQSVCPVLTTDTAETLAARVLQMEHANYAKTIEKALLS
jgi:phosphoribosylglycinamide formyltransferase-1